jgi:ABC-type branched-subunit amino acid transport system permease subunit
LGAFTLKGLPEILREVENYRQLAFGALLIVMMIKRPNGLWPASRPLYEKSDCLEDGTKNTGMEKKND